MQTCKEAEDVVLSQFSLIYAPALGLNGLSAVSIILLNYDRDTLSLSSFSPVSELAEFEKQTLAKIQVVAFIESIPWGESFDYYHKLGSYPNNLKEGLQHATSLKRIILGHEKPSIGR